MLVDADDGSAPPGTSAARLDERRHWERVAYGRGSSDAERAAAFDALARLTPAPQPPRPQPVLELLRPGGPAARPVPRGAAPPAVVPPAPREPQLVGAALWEANHARRPARRPRLRWSLLAALAVVAVVAGALFAVARAADPSSAVFARAQTAGDKAVPAWLADALIVGGGPSTDQMTDDLAASVRLIEDGEHDAYVFRDKWEETICLAASKAVRCATSDDFARDGIRLDALDPDGDNLRSAVHYSWGPVGGLVAEEYEVEEAVSVRFLAASGWADLIEQCLADRGRQVWVSASGRITRLDEGGTDLAYAMAEFDCTRRYLRNGYYFDGAP